MSFALAYRLWSAALLDEYTQLLVALALVRPCPADSVTPAFPVELLISDVYAYARRTASEE